jgi:hypothetical protein
MDVTVTPLATESIQPPPTSAATRQRSVGADRLIQQVARDEPGPRVDPRSDRVVDDNFGTAVSAPDLGLGCGVPLPPK